MFRFNNKLLPDSFSSMFQSNNAVHSYSTRQASNIHLVNPRTTLAHKSIRHSGPDVWNSLPQHVRTLQTPLSFKRAIKRILISKMCWFIYVINVLVIIINCHLLLLWILLVLSFLFVPLNWLLYSQDLGPLIMIVLIYSINLYYYSSSTYELQGLTICMSIIYLWHPPFSRLCFCLFLVNRVIK